MNPPEFDLLLQSSNVVVKCMTRNRKKGGAFSKGSSVVFSISLCGSG